MKKNIFLFLALCIIIIFVAFMVVRFLKTAKNGNMPSPSGPEDNAALEEQGLMFQDEEIDGEQPLQEGEPLLY
jgi:hypothetical protein